MTIDPVIRMCYWNSCNSWNWSTMLQLLWANKIFVQHLYSPSKLFHTWKVFECMKRPLLISTKPPLIFRKYCYPFDLWTFGQKVLDFCVSEGEMFVVWNKNPKQYGFFLKRSKRGLNPPSWVLKIHCIFFSQKYLLICVNLQWNFLDWRWPPPLPLFFDIFSKI